MSPEPSGPREVAVREFVESPRAVYDAAASRYVEFVGTRISPATEAAIDRSLLVAFVELVQDVPAGPVADVGCGPGRVAALLAQRGLDVVGVDVSRGMLAAARSAHPDIRFEEGELAALPIDASVLAGAVCWYSIMYTPADHLREVFDELARVVVPEGCVLLGFQAGDGERMDRAEAYGTHLPLISYLHSPQLVATRLEEAGFTIVARIMRAPEFSHETTPQCFIFGRRRRDL